MRPIIVQESNNPDGFLDAENQPVMVAGWESQFRLIDCNPGGADAGGSVTD